MEVAVNNAGFHNQRRLHARRSLALDWNPVGDALEILPNMMIARLFPRADSNGGISELDLIKEERLPGMPLAGEPTELGGSEKSKRTPRLPTLHPPLPPADD